MARDEAKQRDQVLGVSDFALTNRRRPAAAVTYAAAMSAQAAAGLATHAAATSQHVDPAYAATLAPFASWFGVAAAKRHMRPTMSLALAHGERRMRQAARPLSEVDGPAAALLLTAARVGWTIVSQSTFADRGGALLDLDQHGG